MRRVYAAIGGSAAGVVLFVFLRAQPVVGSFLVGGVFLVGVVTFVAVTVSRERAFNRRAAAVFYPSMTGTPQAREAGEVSR